MKEGVPHVSYSLNLSFNDNASTISSASTNLEYLKINNGNTIQTNTACPSALVSTSVPQALQQVLTHYGVKSNNLNVGNLSSFHNDSLSTSKEAGFNENNVSFSSFQKIKDDSILNSTALTKYRLKESVGFEMRTKKMKVKTNKSKDYKKRLKHHERLKTKFSSQYNNCCSNFVEGHNEFMKKSKSSHTNCSDYQTRSNDEHVKQMDEKDEIEIVDHTITDYDKKSVKKRESLIDVDGKRIEKQFPFGSSDDIREVENSVAEDKELNKEDLEQAVIHETKELINNDIEFQKIEENKIEQISYSEPKYINENVKNVKFCENIEGNCLEENCTTEDIRKEEDISNILETNKKIVLDKVEDACDENEKIDIEFLGPVVIHEPKEFINKEIGFKKIEERKIDSISYSEAKYINENVKFNENIEQNSLEAHCTTKNIREEEYTSNILGKNNKIDLGRVEDTCDENEKLNKDVLGHEVIHETKEFINKEIEFQKIEEKIGPISSSEPYIVNVKFDENIGENCLESTCTTNNIRKEEDISNIQGKNNKTSSNNGKLEIEILSLLEYKNKEWGKPVKITEETQTADFIVEEKTILQKSHQPQIDSFKLNSEVQSDVKVDNIMNKKEQINQSNMEETEIISENLNSHNSIENINVVCPLSVDDFQEQVTSNNVPFENISLETCNKKNISANDQLKNVDVISVSTNKEAKNVENNKKVSEFYCQKMDSCSKSENEYVTCRRQQVEPEGEENSPSILLSHNECDNLIDENKSEPSNYVEGKEDEPNQSIQKVEIIKMDTNLCCQEEIEKDESQKSGHLNIIANEDDLREKVNDKIISLDKQLENVNDTNASLDNQLKNVYSVNDNETSTTTKERIEKNIASVTNDLAVGRLPEDTEEMEGETKCLDKDIEYYEEIEQVEDENSMEVHPYEYLDICLGAEQKAEVDMLEKPKIKGKTLNKRKRKEQRIYTGIYNQFSSSNIEKENKLISNHSTTINENKKGIKRKDMLIQSILMKEMITVMQSPKNEKKSLLSKTNMGSPFSSKISNSTEFDNLDENKKLQKKRTKYKKLFKINDNSIFDTSNCGVTNDSKKIIQDRQLIHDHILMDMEEKQKSADEMKEDDESEINAAVRLSKTMSVGGEIKKYSDIRNQDSTGNEEKRNITDYFEDTRDTSCSDIRRELKEKSSQHNIFEKELKILNKKNQNYLNITETERKTNELSLLPKGEIAVKEEGNNENKPEAKEKKDNKIISTDTNEIKHTNGKKRKVKPKIQLDDRLSNILEAKFNALFGASENKEKVVSSKAQKKSGTSSHQKKTLPIELDPVHEKFTLNSLSIDRNHSTTNQTDEEDDYNIITNNSNQRCENLNESVSDDSDMDIEEEIKYNLSSANLLPSTNKQINKTNISSDDDSTKFDSEEEDPEVAYKEMLSYSMSSEKNVSEDSGKQLGDVNSSVGLNAAPTTKQNIKIDISSDEDDVNIQVPHDRKSKYNEKKHPQESVSENSDQQFENQNEGVKLESLRSTSTSSSDSDMEIEPSEDKQLQYKKMQTYTLPSGKIEFKQLGNIKNNVFNSTSITEQNGDQHFENCNKGIETILSKSTSGIASDSDMDIESLEEEINFNSSINKTSVVRVDDMEIGSFGYPKFESSAMMSCIESPLKRYKSVDENLKSDNNSLNISKPHDNEMHIESINNLKLKHKNNQPCVRSPENKISVDRQCENSSGSIKSDSSNNILVLHSHHVDRQGIKNSGISDGSINIEMKGDPKSQLFVNDNVDIESVEVFEIEGMELKNCIMSHQESKAIFPSISEGQLENISTSINNTCETNVIFNEEDILSAEIYFADEHSENVNDTILAKIEGISNNSENDSIMNTNQISEEHFITSDFRPKNEIDINDSESPEEVQCDIAPDRNKKVQSYIEKFIKQSKQIMKIKSEADDFDNTNSHKSPDELTVTSEITNHSDKKTNEDISVKVIQNKPPQKRKRQSVEKKTPGKSSDENKIKPKRVSKNKTGVVENKAVDMGLNSSKAGSIITYFRRKDGSRGAYETDISSEKINFNETEQKLDVTNSPEVLINGDHSDEKTNKDISVKVIQNKTPQKRKRQSVETKTQGKSSDENKIKRKRVSKNKTEVVEKKAVDMSESIITYFRRKDGSRGAYVTDISSEKINFNETEQKLDATNSPEVLINGMACNANGKELGVSENFNSELGTKVDEGENTPYSFADILSQSHTNRLEKEFEVILDESSKNGGVYSDLDEVEDCSFSTSSSDTDDSFRPPKKAKVLPEKIISNREKFKMKKEENCVMKFIGESESIWDIHKKLNIQNKNDFTNKIHDLVIQNPYPVPRINEIAPNITKNPTREQRQLFKDEGIEFKMGYFTKKEDDRIRKNWTKFCQLHDWDENETAPFLYSSEKSKHGVLSRDQTVLFVQFISHGFQNRTMSSVYRRFRKICPTIKYKNGRFSKEEDEIILAYMKKIKSDSAYGDIATILKRSPAAILKRYQLLKRKNEMELPYICWTKDLGEKLLVNLIEVTCSINLMELKNRTITPEEWAQISERMNIPATKLKKSWLINFYPRFFIPNYFDKQPEINKKLVDIVSSKYSDWEEIDWSTVPKKLGFDLPGIKCCKTLKDLVKNKVPKEIQSNMTEALNYLKGMHLSGCEDRFSFVQDILEETKGGTILPRVT